RRSELALLLCNTAECTQHYKAARQQSVDAVRAAAKDYEPLINTPEEREVYQHFTSKFSRYTEATDGAMAALAAGHPDQATQIVLDPVQIQGHAEAVAVASQNVELNVKEADERAGAVAAASARTN